MTTRQTHHRIVIVGGGTAGITVAARLRRAGEPDVAVIEPSALHYYQPLWTLVGGGRAPVAESVRSEADVMPAGVTWIRDRAEGFEPDERRVVLETGRAVTYDALVVCPGIQLDWAGVPGLPEALSDPLVWGVSSNYRVDLAPQTWELIRNLREGTAVFTMPSGPIKCAGAPQKIAYLAADWWRRKGLSDRIRVVLVLPTPKLFGVPEFNAVLERVVERYGIEVRFTSEVVEVRPDSREVVIADISDGDGAKETVPYDVLHAVPPQSAPDWIKASPLATGDAKGWVEVDKHTLQHVRHPEIFALGDAGSTPNSKTGAAIRKQAPVVVANLRAHLAGRPLEASYDGYASCPITTARNRMLLAEFDYTMRPHPTIPVIDTTRERYDMWLLKRYGLPFMYWHLMLTGRA